MSQIWAELNMIEWPQLEPLGAPLPAASHIFALKSTFLALILFRIKMVAMSPCFIFEADHFQFSMKACEPPPYVGVALPF
jgi:hypothetical protein